MKKVIFNPISHLRRRIRELEVAILSHRHYARLERKAWQDSLGYRQYLDTQLRRTLSKKNAPLPKHAGLLIDRTAELTDLTKCYVLCIGCRNAAEIDCFCSRGAKKVVGIDLYSDNEAVLVMDMHHMTFPDDHFDIIYSSHSLEHAYDVPEVVSEIARVGRPGGLVVIEVPVRYETRGADLVDFGNCANLHAVFEPYIETVLWRDEQEPFSPLNSDGTAVARTIFTLRKEPQEDSGHGR
jgi:SAM-dependent methyltransferase